MAAGVMKRSRGAANGRLWKYNYKILVGTGYWVIVLPVAASQIVTLWMMALSSDFSATAGTQIAELMTPILGAFLVAHSLAPEYRSGIGTVLACKPVSLHRVVTIRVGLAMIAALLLTLATLAVCSFGLKPIDLGPPLLASLPSLWFLSLVALTFASLFRSALAGFAVAAAVWALDLALGYGVHPLLSLQGFSAMIDGNHLATMWLAGKASLLVVGVLLLLWHGKILPRICRSADRADLIRIAGTIALVLLIYVGSGAVTTIGYAYTHRANLPHRDVVWLRRQLAVYGPVPVARLFGPAFMAYITEPPAGKEGEVASPFRVRALEQALARWPGSIWADGIAMELAREQENSDALAACAAYRAVADRFGSSPFAPKALAAVVRIDSKDVPDGLRMSAARRLLQEYPHTPEAERAAGLLEEHYPGQVNAGEMVQAALIAAEAGPRYRRPGWLVTAAKILAPQDKARAHDLARKAVESGVRLVDEDTRNPWFNSDIRQWRSHIDSSVETARKLLQE